ncbi:DUF1801 domain-containing protein [Streptomyces sp. NPDC086554]|uniref:iron chaperone n=1 Tax=Streptomyces sp. NPDC086554 TaxID=3154864 RepID=UPI00342C6BEA
MVQSAAEDVTGYLAEVPDGRRPALTRLRELCLAELPGFDEVMAYGMPAYERQVTAEIAFASQKQYVSFYLLRGEVREGFEERLAGHDMGQGLSDGSCRGRDPWHAHLPRCRRLPTLRVVALLRLAAARTRARSALLNRHPARRPA